MCVNTTPFRSHTQHFLARDCFSDALCVFSDTIVHHSRSSCLIRTRCGLIFHLSLSLPQHIPSPLCPSHIDEQPLDPHTAGRPGRLSIPRPLTSKDEDDFKRVIQNMKVQKVQMIFAMMHAQITNFKNRDHEIHGLGEQEGWTSGHRRTYLCLAQLIATQSTSKMSVFSDTVRCLGRLCQDHLEAARTWRKQSHHRIRSTPRIPTLLDFTGKPMEFVRRIHVVKTTTEIIAYINIMLRKKNMKYNLQYHFCVFVQSYSKIRHRTRRSVATMQSVSRSSLKT